MPLRSESAATLFAGPGEVRALARALDWAATPLGPVERWPTTLRDVVRMVLDSPFPLNLWCGAERVLIYNDAYRRVLGAKHPASLGQPGQLVWAEIWDAVYPMFARIDAGGPPVYAEDAPFLMQRAGTADGETAWFTFGLSAIRDAAGTTVAYFNPATETTRRLQAEREAEAARAAAERGEARVREVFERAPTFLAVLRGPDHVFELVNDAYYRLVGRRALIGRALREALPEVVAQGFVALLDEVLATGEPFVGREVPVMLARVEGQPAEERFVDFVYQPLSDDGHTYGGVVAHGSDVTAQVIARREVERARADAEQARRRAEEANRAKAEFLAAMSHELRTPLNAIGGYVQLIDLGVRGPVTDEQREDLARVRRSQQHLLGLINDVLNFARLEAGRVQFDYVRVAVQELLVGVEGLVAPQAAERGHHLDVRACDPALTAWADPERATQILVNLLTNAVKYTEPGGRIAARCEGAQDAAGRRAVRVAVSDTGVGIAADKLPTIFEPFVQVGRQLNRPGEGIGLGLAISRDLARAMGGDLTVESVEGVGSTFTLTLPRDP